jgi:nucleoside-triphosphatase THEP1
MILVAVCGAVGSGKTSRMLETALFALQKGKTVSGFLALGGARRQAGRGADTYELQLLPDGEPIPFARRKDAEAPGYHFEASATVRLRAWADGLQPERPPDLLLLDEFGKLEIEGKGHFAWWPRVEAAAPAVVLIAVRDSNLRGVERLLGRSFDLVVSAADPAAAERLRSLLLHHGDWTTAGMFGAVSGAMEATVGAVLHSIKMPFRGLVLSSFQSVMMMLAGDRMAVHTRVVWVPFLAAGIKALSPTGNRLRPMLAISVQGLLFTGAVSLLGWNAAGVTAGAFLIGAWAAAQGLLLQYLLVGADLFKALDTAVHWLAGALHLGKPGLTGLILFWVALWGSLSSGLSLWFWYRRHSRGEKLLAALTKKIQPLVWKEAEGSRLLAFRRALGDLLRPQFWLPLGIIASILLASGSGWERILWMVLRAATVGWLLFALIRMLRPGTWANWLQRKGLWGPAIAFRRALPQGPPRKPGEDPDPPAGK